MLRVERACRGADKRGNAMRPMLLILSLACLSACSKEPSVTADNASMEEVATKVLEAGGGGYQMKPGEWVSEARLDTVDIPGMPPQAAAHMKEMMAKQVSGEKFCLTPEQASKPSAEFFSGLQSGCSYDHFEMAGGKLSGTMRCGEGGASQVIKFNGTYSAEQYEMHMDSTMSGGSQGPMRMAMTIASKRIGDCSSGGSTAAN